MKDDVITEPRVFASIRFVQSVMYRVFIVDAPESIMSVQFRISSASLCLQACDVGRCFLSGSISGAVMREDQSIHSGKEFCTSLRHFGMCSRGNYVCSSCSDVLMSTSI